MAHIVGISTQTNAKGVVTKITVDLKKHPKVKETLTEMGLISKNEKDLEREAFYKKISNPNNLTEDEVFDTVHKEIASWKWDK